MNLPPNSTSRVTLLDNGMGTELQARGLKPGESPEDWNVERPDDIVALHRAAVAAGAQIIYTNTFGANPLKYRGKHDLATVIRQGLEIARRTEVESRGEDGRRRVRVALDVGPTGKLLKPAGDLDFEDAVAAFAETIKTATSPLSNSKLQLTTPDLIVIETMSDVRELKAAVLAAKECGDLPVYATVSLGADGRLLTGASVECVATLLESLGVDAYGFNCGLGPVEMLPFVERLAKVSTKPVIAKPNAGLPKVVDGRTVFEVGPDEFAVGVARLVAAGATIVGGCCGTTPDHIREIKNLELKVKNDRKASAISPPTQVSSGTSVVTISPHEGLVIGERINPTGKKLLKEAYARGDTAYVLREAVKQVEAGAAVLDVNCGVPGLDEAALLERTVENVQSVVTCPLQLDTADPTALERALRRVNGKALVNSVNGKRESMDAVFPLVKRYGGTIVALCLDETGIPPTSEGRLAIARRILAEGAKYGFQVSDFIFDALTLAVSSDPNAARVTLETVKRLTDELGVNTVLGVSNVSFGLPNRVAINNTMYALAKRAGLSAAIANPAVIRDEIDPAAEDVLLGRDPNCTRWIGLNTEAQRHRDFEGLGAEPPGKNVSAGQLCVSVPLCLNHLTAAIRRGLKDDARTAAAEMLKGGVSPLEVIEKGIVPALEEVGSGFEKGTLYLPQLLMAADAAGEAFGVVKTRIMEESAGNSKLQNLKTSKRPIVLATVKGDIHDIGKNIVRALLENYGFDVIDLGRDVAPETIVETAKKTQAALVGLSALMTTTVGAMAETIRRLQAAGLDCKTVVGGAVVTQDYADSIGADYYAKDAMRTVRIAESLLRVQNMV